VAYRLSEMGFLVHTRPDEARRRILSVIRRMRGERDRAAEHFGVTRRTLDRWLVELGALEDAASMRQSGRR